MRRRRPTLSSTSIEAMRGPLQRLASFALGASVVAVLLFFLKLAYVSY
jgi:hypothetical protein